MKKLLIYLTLISLMLFTFVTVATADEVYGTDSEKMAKTVTVTLQDGTTEELHLYNIVTDLNHADYGKVLALTWYYDSEGELSWKYTYQAVSVSTSGVISYAAGISPQNVVVANFQCDAAHDTTTKPNVMKSFNFTFYVNDSTPNNNIQHVFMPNSLVNLRTNMFRNCPALKTCDFTENSELVSIGQYVFNRATSLKSFFVPSGVTTLPDGQGSSYGVFYNCTSLESVTFGENSALTYIGTSCFNGCSALSSIVVPKGVTSLGTYCFRYTTNLKYASIPDSVLGLNGFTFQHSGIQKSPFTVNSLCEKFGKYEFDHALSLTELIIPAGVTSLPDATDSNYGFAYGCVLLTKVMFAPNSQLEYIGTRAFMNCTSLSELLLPNSVKTVGINAFSYTALVNSPFSTTSGCTAILNEAFSNIASLKNLNIPSGIIELSQKAFCGCSGLEAVYFNDNSQMKVLGSQVFEGCSSLTVIELPEGLTTLVGRTFVSCKSLKEIVLPNSVTTIGPRIFQGCSSLTYVNFGAGLTNVTTENDHYSLTYQSGVKTVVLPATFTADSFLNGGKVTYMFTNSNTVFYYAGTQEQFDALCAVLKGKEGNGAFNTVPTVENGRLVLITACQGFYNDEHIGEKTVSYENGFDEYGCVTTLCTRCQKTVVEEINPIIVALGYSVDETNQKRTFIASGFIVDKDLLASYEELNGVTLEIGIVFSNAANMNTVPESLAGYNTITDGGASHYSSYNYKIAFPSKTAENYDKYKDFEFVVACFVAENGEYSFCQSGEDNAIVSTLDSGFTTTTLATILECTNYLDK